MAISSPAEGVAGPLRWESASWAREQEREQAEEAQEPVWLPREPGLVAVVAAESGPAPVWEELESGQIEPAWVWAAEPAFRLFPP
ncbi:MAG: hypothetical protein K0S45_2138 [Nitrospira sp.]|jgi:hypothetical protein|nr:hypothetical protein [Nitrospira sp.]